jgi:hypothetical protein
VVDKVRRDSPTVGGGFVKQDAKTVLWYEIGDDKARDKVGHAIRRCLEVKPPSSRSKEARIMKKKNTMDTSASSSAGGSLRITEGYQLALYSFLDDFDSTAEDSDSEARSNHGRKNKKSREQENSSTALVVVTRRNSLLQAPVYDDDEDRTLMGQAQSDSMVVPSFIIRQANAAFGSTIAPAEGPTEDNSLAMKKKQKYTKEGSSSAATNSEKKQPPQYEDRFKEEGLATNKMRGDFPTLPLSAEGGPVGVARRNHQQQLFNAQQDIHDILWNSVDSAHFPPPPAGSGRGGLLHHHHHHQASSNNSTMLDRSLFEQQSHYPSATGGDLNQKIINSPTPAGVAAQASFPSGGGTRTNDINNFQLANSSTNLQEQYQLMMMGRGQHTNMTEERSRAPGAALSSLNEFQLMGSAGPAWDFHHQPQQHQVAARRNSLLLMMSNDQIPLMLPVGGNVPAPPPPSTTMIDVDARLAWARRYVLQGAADTAADTASIVEDPPEDDIIRFLSRGGGGGHY